MSALVEHVLTAAGVDVALGIVTLAFRGRIFSVLWMTASAVVWAVRRPDRRQVMSIAAPAKHRCAPRGACSCSPPTRNPARASSTDLRRIARLHQPSACPEHQRVTNTPDGPIRDFLARFGNGVIEYVPVTEQQLAGAIYAVVIDGDRRYTIRTQALYRAFLADPPDLSDDRCIRWYRAESMDTIPDGTRAPVGRRCPACGNMLAPGETHAPRPPRAADMIRTTDE